VFAVPQDQRHRITNRSVLLVDDAITTGANLYETAKTLHRMGGGPVRGLVLARVLRHGV
jgi:predicted amidophosphoribosyltransferase